MNTWNEKLKTHAPVVLRYAMSLVIIWFSLQQFTNPGNWIAYVPDSVVTFLHTNPLTLVHFNAWFELIFGIFLVLGWNTRLAAFLLALHLLDIMWVVGYGEIGVRDFGLAIATLVVCMNGADLLCLDNA